MNMPKVGIGVIIIKDRKFLMGWRKAKHGSGTWCPPGGHLEFGESLEDCARRETLEETGISIRNVRFAGVTNDIWEDEGKHYITITMLADWESGEPKAMEPDKADDWKWFSWDDVPDKIFLTMQNMLKQGFRPEGL